MSDRQTTAVSEPKTRTGAAYFFARLWKEKPLGTASGIIIVLFVLTAIFADVLAPHGMLEMSLADRLSGPSARFLLGTDHIGRDLLTRLIYGARVSLTVGLAATALNVVVALVIGGASGFVGGKVDLATQRFVDAWVSIPGLLILLTIMSIVGQGLVQTIVVLGVTGGIGGSRVVRSAVIAIKENVYFQAAEAIGSSRGMTLIRHVVPNIVAPVIIVFSINIGAVIISEASLSFLGFGLPLEVPSWGGMLSREGREYIGAGAVAGVLARHLPYRAGVLPEHVRRRGQRPARPAAAGWRGAPRPRAGEEAGVAPIHVTEFRFDNRRNKPYNPHCAVSLGEWLAAERSEA